MQKVKIEPFKVIGISVRTTNENGQAATDIPRLWEEFMSQGILEKIPDKIDHAVYSLYTNYEGDYMRPYDTILGCKVNTLAHIPEGMVGLDIAGGNYVEFIAKGDLTKNVVVNTWYDIWKKPMPRSYVVDFEIYGEKARNPADAEVSIFIGVKE